MGDPKTVLEGCVKYRDKKKWKARWAVVSKLSPVADCLHLQLYRDSKERCKNGPTKASLSLEGFLGLETGFTLDKESNTMALICSELVVVLAFDSRELLIQWQVKIRTNLAEEQQFLVQIAHVPSKSKLACGPARLHLQDHTFCLVAGVPPRLLGTWPIKELRRFGVIEGKFCFEGGSLCGKGEGLHILLTNQSEELAQSMDLASKGKLLGKRKTLSRKNSVLETSTRTPLHKPSRHGSSKCSSTDLSRPLLSSGSESSTCDACSEILRTSDPLGCDDIYHSAVTKAASTCRIHYRWPSCMSRWGQSSTVTASDVESMDTVSVTLSDYQGAAHSTVSSKGTSHGSSLLCLCDRQGTWPFNHCGKCGRQVYSSLGHQNGLNGSHRPVSPDQQANDVNNGFSPQWTMNAALPSPSIEETCPSSRKESAYQMMQPGSDRASLCSHTSRSSSTSTASSSGSEYSVPRNYLETLYDKPKALHIKSDNSTNLKNSVFNGGTSMNHKLLAEHCNSTRGQLPLDNTIVCACHEPISDWMVSQKDQTSRPQCSCWSQLSLSMRSEKEVHVTVASNKSASANPSPSSSPKKVQYNTSGGAIRTNTVSIAAMSQSVTCTCYKGSINPYTNYAVPRMALSGMYLKDKQLTLEDGTKHVTENPLHTAPSEDYDVPKKFADMHLNRDIAVKSGVPCKCNSLPQPIQKSLETYNNHHGFDPTVSDNPMQICTCQRVMLWAGSFVPCLGRSSKTATDHGWQRDRRINHPVTHVQSTLLHGAVCCEPHRTSELILVNGKPKHVLHNHHVQNVNDSSVDSTSPKCHKEDEPVKLLPEFTTSLNEKGGSVNDLSCNYVNIDFTGDSSSEKPQVQDDSTINYANLDFSQTVPFYENSNLVLNRLEQNGGSKVPNVERPPLPPRGQSFTSKSSQLPATTNSSSDSIKSQSHGVYSSSMPNSTTKHINGSAYELMCFEKQNIASLDDDYLMMQPIFPRNSDKMSKTTEGIESVPSTNEFDKNKSRSNSEDDSNLPLRPFMPLSYQQSEIYDSDKWMANGVPSCIEAFSKKHYLINEDIEIRSSRSNSLSELKKIVLLRKRSSSVDGKSNIPIPDLSMKSNPASPLGSPRSFIQRKNSLFSKLNLRSKEKSMSTNEIIPPAVLPTASNSLVNYRRNTLHRSADCLKLNEECVNSDDDSSDLCENSQKEVSTIKRSSSVPCRPTVPEHLLSPLKTNIIIIPEMNDLNKETSNQTVKSTSQSNESRNCLQRKYSLGSQEKPKINLLHQAHRTVCDTFKHLSSNEHCDSITETHVAFPRNANHTFGETSILDPYKSTSSSSSDTSDFVDSLTRCSRSSSSSSGSTSSDYMRSEDIYNQKPIAKSNIRNCTIVGPSDIPHKTRFRSHEDNEYQKCNADLELNSSKDNFCPSHISENHELSKQTCSAQLIKDSTPIVISNCTITDVTKKSMNCRRTRCESKSPNSSTSSLSTSPSTTDYSSSSSTNCSNVGYVSGKKCTIASESYKLSITSQPQAIPNVAATSNNGYTERVETSYELASETSTSLTDCNVDVCH